MRPEWHYGKTLVLGLGNDVLTDDAVGLLAVRALQERFAVDSRFDFTETTEMGLTLLDLIAGYRELVLIDSIQTGRDNPGTVRAISPSFENSSIVRTPHFLGVPETIALGNALGFPMPQTVRIFGIEVADPFTLGTQLTPELAAALPHIVETLAEEISQPPGCPAPEEDATTATHSL